MNSPLDTKISPVAAKETLPEYLEDCPCKKKSCERYRKCQECHSYHRERKRLKAPYCLREPRKPFWKMFA